MKSRSTFNTGTNLPLSVTEKTNRKPSPVLIYCSLIAPNSSCPAVSRTKEKIIYVIAFVFVFHKWLPLKVRPKILSNKEMALPS